MMNDVKNSNPTQKTGWDPFWRCIHKQYIFTKRFEFAISNSTLFSHLQIDIFSISTFDTNEEILLFRKDFNPVHIATNAFDKSPFFAFLVLKKTGLHKSSSILPKNLKAFCCYLCWILGSSITDKPIKVEKRRQPSRQMNLLVFTKSSMLSPSYLRLHIGRL